MKLATLMTTALAGGMAMAGVTIEAHRTLKGEMARHSQALLAIEEAEIDAKAAFAKETLRCNSNSACLKAARNQ